GVPLVAAAVILLTMIVSSGRRGSAVAACDEACKRAAGLVELAAALERGRPLMVGGGLAAFAAVACVPWVAVMFADLGGGSNPSVVLVSALTHVAVAAAVVIVALMIWAP